MKKIINNKILLLFIITLAAFLRFYQLGENPPSLTWDEAAWGYNAYSLGIDGKDEFGRFLPLDYLESFGDFKPPMYVYLDILPIKLLGLNEFATRFPSALFGTLTVLLTYFLVLRIFNHKSSIINHHSEKIALFSSLFLAISPWHIMLSRAAFEANVAAFFIVLGVFLFLAGVNHIKRLQFENITTKQISRVLSAGIFNPYVFVLILFSAVSFILSAYTFNTARVVSPLLVLVLLFSFRKDLLSFKKELAAVFLIGLVLSFPLMRFLTTPQAKLRFHEVNIFSNIAIVERTNQEIRNDNNALWSRLIHNRRFAYGVEYLKHYLDNLSPSFLFIKGDGNPKFSTQDVGELYLWDLPFFILGILLLIRQKVGHWWVIPLWLLLGIMPAGVARETPHALRIESSLPMFQIIVAYGFVCFLTWVKGLNLRFATYDPRKISYALIIASCFFLFLNFVYFYHGYFSHYARIYSGEWQYGYKEAISYVSAIEKSYDKIVFTTDLGRPYIYFLFYKKYPPQKFRKEADITREVFGFVHINSFDKYVFAKDLSQYYGKGNNLYIDTPGKIPGSAKVQKVFYLLNQKESLIAYTL
jgi:4-amino-4-deoxy-L-arabinose transferase-like glycosyltransferase